MEIMFAIIILNIAVSYRGFSDFGFFEKYKFETEGILARKEYVRMISSGFLHGDYMHLAFNMLSFYFFADVVLLFFNQFEFAILYLGSLLGGNMLSLYIHRHHSDYSAIGASGAVSGIIYSAIALVPDGQIGLIILPGLGIPSWLFGVVYIVYSIFGIKSQRGNIGHDAHLGGALTGLILTVAYLFTKYDFNYLYITLMLVPTLAFLYLVVYHPEWMITGKINWSNNPFNKYRENQKLKRDRQQGDKWLRNIQKKDKPGRNSDGEKDRDEELNELLDKVNRVGIGNLTEKEKRRLDELSQ